MPECSTLAAHATATVTGDAERYVFSRVAGVRIEDKGVTIVNVATGARATLPSSAAALVVSFIDPILIEEALHNACDDSCALLEQASNIQVMIELGVLVPEAQEAGPGPAPTELPAGWNAAADFIKATHTSEDVAFLSTQDMTELLLLHLASGRQPSAYFNLEDTPFVSLPLVSREVRSSANDLGGTLIRDALLDRRTTRRFEDRPISTELLSELLRWTWGETDRVENPLGDYFLRKTSPSGGALHCIETYVLVRNVTGIAAGSYHYCVRRHGLERISAEPPDEWLLKAAADQYWVCECPAVFISVGFLPRMAWKYNFSRAFRAVMAEAGHLSQTFNLVATSLGLGPFTTIAMRDELIERQLGLDPMLQPPLILNAAGFPDRSNADPTRPRREGTDR